MDVFIYDLPFKERSELVSLLNAQDAWYELGGHCLGYDITQLSNFRSRATSKRGETPADLLLIHWGQKNRTVGELFLHLRKLQLFQAMSIIRNYVPTKLHRLLDQPLTPQSMLSSPISTCEQAMALPVPYHIPQNKYVENNLNHTESKSFYRTYCPSKINGKAKANLNSCSSWAPSKGVKIQSHKTVLNILPNAVNIRASSSPGEGAHSPGSSSLLRRGSPGLPSNETGVWLNEVSFGELKAACNNFDMRTNLLGRGGFGEVYRGIWNGQEVAVKRIREEKRKVLGSDEFEKCISQMIMELRTLMSFPARNILPLMAYCFDDKFQTDPCLVYQLMANGSLADRLRCKNNTDVLSWEQRISIATGTACGLVYLHANQITHVDIKSPNILLDEYLEPKIGDFGLVRWLDQSAENSYRIVSSVQGTAPYLPDDYIRSKQLTPAVDTFCFGIVLFELITAKSPSWQDPESRYRMRDIMLRRDCNLEKWIDPKLSNCGWAKSLFIIGQLCAVSSRKLRPEMKQVFEALKKLSEFNSPPNYDSNIYHPDVVSSVTNFTNHMSECLSGNHIGDNIPLVLLSNTSSNGPPTPTMGDPSSFSEEDDPFSSSQDMSSRQTTTRDFIEEPNVKSEEFNIPNLSFLRNDEEPPREESAIPDLSNLRIQSSGLIPDLSILAMDNGIPNLSTQSGVSLSGTPGSNSSRTKSSVLKKLKQMDNMDNSPCSSKLANIQRSIDSCTNVDDIL